MPYVTQLQIQAKIPAPLLNDALDDDDDGNADAGLLDQIIANESMAVDALLSARFAVPFADPAPAKVQRAAFVFVLAAIYARRPGMEKNPYNAEKTAWETQLRAIGSKDSQEQLDSSSEGAPGLVAMAGSAVPVPLQTSVITPATPAQPVPQAGNTDEIFEE